MNEVKQRNPTNELSTDINVITAEINAYQRVAGEAIFEIGRRLKHVKESKMAERHGGWTEWLGSVNLDRRRASEFIRVYEEFSKEDVRTFGHFGVTAFLHLIDIPPEQREVEHELPSGETKKPEEMTVRELRELKRQLKEREAALKDAETRASIAEQDAQVLRDMLESIEDQPPKVEIKTEYVEVYDEVSQLKLKRYEELFGDVSMYEGKTTRVTNGDAITYTVFEFSEDVRKFIEKYGHLTHFAREFNEMIAEGKEEYKNAINDMFRFLKMIERNLDESEAVIINM